MEPVAPRELRAVVERDGSPHGGREGAQHLCHDTGNMVGALAGEADGDEQARMALVEAGLAGIEVYYGLYPPDRRKQLQTLADKHNLLALGGSDYHGPGRAAECPLGGSNTPLEAGEKLLALHAAQATT